MSFNGWRDTVDVSRGCYIKNSNKIKMTWIKISRFSIERYNTLRVFIKYTLASDWWFSSGLARRLCCGQCSLGIGWRHETTRTRERHGRCLQQEHPNINKDKQNANLNTLKILKIQIRQKMSIVLSCIIWQNQKYWFFYIYFLYFNNRNFRFFKICFKLIVEYNKSLYSHFVRICYAFNKFSPMHEKRIQW